MSNPNPNPDSYVLVDEESEEGTESEEEDSEETQEDSEEEEEQDEFIPVTESPGVLSSTKGEKGVQGRVCSSAGESGENSQGNEWNRGDIDGLFCPICMEAWTTTGDHHVCCLPCGHIYGLSCIRKWLQQRGTSRKCPQCNQKCTFKDVRKLFASRIVAIDGESQKRIRSLEAKCISLEKESAVSSKKEAKWRNSEAEWKRREAVLQQELHQLKEKTNYLEHLLDVQSRSTQYAPSIGSGQVQPPGHNLGSDFNSQGPFVFQKELRVDGARLFDIDASSKILLMARRLQGLGGTHVLTKMSLIAPHEKQDISLPSDTKAVRDLHICPSDGSLALFASLGKKLSVLSTESNNVILAYDLPECASSIRNSYCMVSASLLQWVRTSVFALFKAAAWSCSWDLNNSHQIYAGLQNGSLLMFDMRQTSTPLESVNGLTSNPVHTIHSLLNSTIPSDVTTILSASSIGICQWSFGGSAEMPFLVSETGYQGVCISLAYCSSSDDIVASYRPRMASSQPFPTPVIGQGVQGYNVHLKRAGSNCYQKLGVTCANVNDVRLPRSTIMNTENYGCLFASGDELSGGLVLQQLPSFAIVQHLKLPKQPIHDVKYVNAFDGGLLGCLSEDRLQLYSSHALK